jgi:uncharacterized protein with von Willebrand factor type A (vWA) domain
MFLDFFLLLKNHGLPVTMQEYLRLLEGLDKELGSYSVENFYYLCRSVMIKHEQHLDKFDQLFGHYFEGMEYIPEPDIENIPEDWLRQNWERFFSEEEKQAIDAMGGIDKLMERFRELMNEQTDRHEGGNKWIGTKGASPFGAYGYNPEGFRIGQNESRNRRATKVWDKREFRNLSDDVELDTRNLKLALKRLRIFTREGPEEEIDLDSTINKTTKNGGILELEMAPSKQNRVKVLLFLDVGGSMDDHIDICTRLFSAARHEFKHMDYYYFHNCLYSSVWKDSRRRFSENIPTFDVLHRFNPDYKVIFVGDATMSPYEIISPGGSVEHFNHEAGITWLERVKEHFPDMIWLNPQPREVWDFYPSIQMIREFMDDRMFPLTIGGLTDAMKYLKDGAVESSE